MAHQSVTAFNLVLPAFESDIFAEIGPLCGLPQQIAIEAREAGIQRAAESMHIEGLFLGKCNECTGALSLLGALCSAGP